ncbi:MAG: hypothetical protein FJW40_04240 [Acidobacteria bacterium]|nr:hypothetical protein [Acidobacteriota bacterium]
MKYCAYLVLSAGLACAQEFHTGQAARLVIGQPNFTAQRPGASQVLLGACSGIAFGGDTLIVADSSRIGAAPDNHRVLVFRNAGSQFPSPLAEIQPDIARCPVCVGSASVVLGQPDFIKNEVGLTASGLRSPTAVATDGRVVVVADTDNNRVLIWNSIPTRNGQPADVVLGQDSFTSLRRITIDNKSFRGPQGVWVHNGKLFVADTQNHRVLIWNSIPSRNDQPADTVLGQPNFTTAPEPDLTRQTLNAKNNTMLNPVSVSTDGIRLFVSDLGYNRVLIWNSIPTQNQAPADIVLGQPDFESIAANNAPKMCAATGKDSAGKDTFPRRCASTLDFPRFALSDGRRLFVADGGNDRVLVWTSLPTRNGQPADVILGQYRDDINLISDSTDANRIAAADSLRTPMSLAFDGTNLYVSEPFNRRVMVFTPGERTIAFTGVRNAASREIFAIGEVRLAGTPKENDEITIKIGGKDYKYKLLKDEKFTAASRKLADLINAGAGDPNVLATLNVTSENVAIILTARVAGEPGNKIEYSTSVSDGATVQASTAGATLAGGQEAAKIAPGTIVSILGDKLADRTASAVSDTQILPKELADTQVYFDGIRAPLLHVSPNQINAQIPFEVQDSQGINAYVRTRRANGQVTISSAAAVPIIPQNPGIFAEEGDDPRPGVVLHGSSFAQGTVSVDGSANANDVATVVINQREYAYTVKTGDTLEAIRDGLIAKINEGQGDPQVFAFAAGVFTRIRLRAKVEGPAGNGIPISGKTNDGAQVILTATVPELCCANKAQERITEANPAVPGETIIVYATGLGLVKPTAARLAIETGKPYTGPEVNEPEEFVSSLAGGKTANVIFARLLPGRVGIYEVQLELNSDIPTNPRTQLTIAQSFFVSNIITFPVKNPRDDAPAP